MMLALAVDWNKLVHESVEAIVFAVIGILLLAVSFVVLDKLTPGSLWKELIDEHNTAIAVLLGAFALGISIIISAAMVG